MSRQIFPRVKKPKRDVSDRRYRVDYSEMLYDGGSGCFTKYYRTRLVAYIDAFFQCYAFAWEGKAVLIDQYEGLRWP